MSVSIEYVCPIIGFSELLIAWRFVYNDRFYSRTPLELQSL